ncbi:hypothetical protein Tco_0773071 [Tanacetum coccineum]|uniref:Uncharacterized protein n=1 Tax=Tanacetum coccineum TaxID=301880 RepID=A0ABQ4ZJU3_9ASTR
MFGDRGIQKERREERPRDTYDGSSEAMFADLGHFSYAAIQKAFRLPRLLRTNTRKCKGGVACYIHSYCCCRESRQIIQSGKILDHKPESALWLYTQPEAISVSATFHFSSANAFLHTSS